MPNKHRPVMVEWLDSCEPATNADLTSDDFPSPQIITSLGWIAKDHPDHIVVVSAVKVDDHVGQTYDYAISIPKVSIMRIFDVEIKCESP